MDQVSSLVKPQASGIYSSFKLKSVNNFLGQLQDYMEIYINNQQLLQQKPFKILGVCLKHSEGVPLTNEFLKLKSKSLNRLFQGILLEKREGNKGNYLYIIEVA